MKFEKPKDVKPFWLFVNDLYDYVITDATMYQLAYTAADHLYQFVKTSYATEAKQIKTVMRSNPGNSFVRLYMNPAVEELASKYPNKMEEALNMLKG